MIRALTRAWARRRVRSRPAWPALQRAVDEPPDLVVLDLGLPDLDGAAAAAHAAAGQRGAGDRGHRPGRRRGDRARAGRRRGRLPGQAVQRRAARRPDPGGAAAHRHAAPAPTPARRSATCVVDLRARDGGAGRRARWTCGRGSSTCCAYLAARPGRGGDQARAARRGLAVAVRRGRQDRRRAPVLAAPQAGRDRRGAAASCTRSAASA